MVVVDDAGAVAVASSALGVPSSGITVSVLTGGITNKLYLAKTASQKVLVRQFGLGTEVIVDRAREAVVMAALFPVGMAPRVLLTFENGYVYEFIEGRTMEPAEMAEEASVRMIAPRVAEWHAVTPAGVSRAPVLFETLRRWLALGPREYPGDQQRTQRLRGALDLDKLAKDLDVLEADLAELRSPVVFSHNDLLSGNVLVLAGQERVTFIDFEYGAYNPRGFDLGNHFAEYCGFECEWARFPATAAQRRTFLELYLATSLGRAATEHEIQALDREALAYSLAAHLWWGIWSLLQSKLSDLQEIDYLEYAITKINRFYETRDWCLHKQN
jgi:ethanolamine kinase